MLCSSVELGECAMLCDSVELVRGISDAVWFSGTSEREETGDVVWFRGNSERNVRF